MFICQGSKQEERELFFVSIFKLLSHFWTNFQRWHLICVPIVTHLGMTSRTCVDGALHFQVDNETFWPIGPGNPRHYVSIKDIPAGILHMPEHLWHHPVQIYSASLVVFGKCMWPVCLLVLWMVNHEDSWTRNGRTTIRRFTGHFQKHISLSGMCAPPHFCLCTLLLLLLLQPLSCAEILYSL